MNIEIYPINSLTYISAKLSKSHESDPCICLLSVLFIVRKTNDATAVKATSVLLRSQFLTIIAIVNL